MASDTKTVWPPKTRKACEFNPLNERSQKRLANTVFAREWLICAIDEAHAARKVNQLYMATFQLRVRSRIAIAVTATPIITSLMASCFLAIPLPWVN